MGEEPAPKFPTFYFLYVYVVRKGIKEFPKRCYSVLKRLLTNSWKPKQVPSSYVGNQSGRKKPASRFSNHTL